jgi:hypothetical protein
MVTSITRIQSAKTDSPGQQNAWIPAVTMFRSSLSIYIYFVYNNFYFISVMLTAHWRLLSEQPSYN